MLKSRTRLVAGTATVLVAAATLTACGGAKAGDDSPKASGKSCVDTSGDTVKLGFINSLTGAMAISEKTVSKVLDMAADEINASGGIMGKKIEPIQEDGATDWPTFAEKSEKLRSGK